MRPDGPELVGLVEGHAGFCRRCGHDLVGLSGERCPRCKRTLPALVYRPRPAPGGRYVVLVVLGMGLVLAGVGWQHHHLHDPEPEPSHAAPTEQASPAAASPDHAGARAKRVGLRPDGYAKEGAR